ncbi:MAG: DinB family protein [Chthonomonadaceae bacterium]|nr:DinB family protein [Chthonomonadaceae bacterium]
MDILDRLLGHDAWTTRQLLLRCRELTDEQLDRPFDIGNRSLRQTFEHIIACMESHTDLMLERTTADYDRDEETIDGMLTRLTIVAKDFAEFATAVEREGRADAMCTNAEKTRKWPLGSLIAHLITHSMHHRAQVMYLLEQLGVQNVMEGDALGWEGQARGWSYRWCNSYGSTVAD